MQRALAYIGTAELVYIPDEPCQRTLPREQSARTCSVTWRGRGSAVFGSASERAHRIMYQQSKSARKASARAASDAQVAVPDQLGGMRVEGGAGGEVLSPGPDEQGALAARFRGEQPRQVGQKDEGQVEQAGIFPQHEDADVLVDWWKVSVIKLAVD